MQHVTEIDGLEIEPGFHPEPMFDNRTMYCQADISDLTGWNAHTIDEQVKLGNFPKPLNPRSRASFWERWRVNMAYLVMIASEPDAEEQAKINRYREIYDQLYRDALLFPVFLKEELERAAQDYADRKVQEYSYYDDDDREEAWQYFHEQASEDHHDFAELSARWKAWQAVRFRD